MQVKLESQERAGVNYGAFGVTGTVVYGEYPLRTVVCGDEVARCYPQAEGPEAGVITTRYQFHK